MPAPNRTVSATATTDDYPIAYRDLAGRFGAPSSIEAARTAWSYVVKGAEKGTVVTLIAPGGPSRGDWAAVVPCQVPDPGRCPVWPVSEARPRLGDVVQAAADYRDPVPQILARHRQPVAAVIAASILEGMPADGERIDVQSLLEAGGKVTLEYDPGESGSVDSHGDVLYPPERGRANHGGEQSSYLPPPLTRSRQPNDARAERNYPRSGTVSRRRYLKAEPRSIIRNGRVFHPVSQRAPPCWPTASMAQFTNERLPAAHLPDAFPTPFRSPPSLLPPVRPLAGAAGPVGFANGDGGEQAAHGAHAAAPRQLPGRLDSSRVTLPWPGEEAVEVEVRADRHPQRLAASPSAVRHSTR